MYRWKITGLTQLAQGEWFFEWPKEPNPPDRKSSNSPPIDPSKEFIFY